MLALVHALRRRKRPMNTELEAHSPTRETMLRYREAFASYHDAVIRLIVSEGRGANGRSRLLDVLSARRTLRERQSAVDLLTTDIIGHDD
jgi:hypothetical protein